jgi:hypothetical protein
MSAEIAKALDAPEVKDSLARLSLSDASLLARKTARSLYFSVVGSKGLSGARHWDRRADVIVFMPAWAVA